MPSDPAIALREANAAATAGDWARVAALVQPLLGRMLPQRAEGTAAAHHGATMDLRTYGVGAQILRHLGVRRMKLLGHPRRMPSMTGYGLEVTGFVAAPETH